ncbi:MAG: VanZ family protein, partial [Lachnospiraceae bacterium]|nr:VanZ family protein [Lachnospiraceae bacterium]
MKIQQQTGRVLLLIAWIMLMLGIFWFSAQDASTSTKESVAVGTLICRIFDQGYEELTPTEQRAMAEAIDHAVRKSAHFCEYMLLGMLTAG